MPNFLINLFRKNFAPFYFSDEAESPRSGRWGWIQSKRSGFYFSSDAVLPRSLKPLRGDFSGLGRGAGGFGSALGFRPILVAPGRRADFSSLHYLSIRPPLAALVSGGPAAEQPVASPASEAPATKELEEEALVALRLRDVLRDADAARLGFDPGNVPEGVLVTFPMLRLAQQLAFGRVEVAVDEIRGGVEEKLRPAFARAAADLRVVIPLSAVFPHIRESARPALAPAARQAEGSFPAPFVEGGEEFSPGEADAACAPSRAGLLSRAPGSGMPPADPLRAAEGMHRPFPQAEAGETGMPAASLTGLLRSAAPASEGGSTSLGAADDLGASYSAASLQTAPPARPGSARFASAVQAPAPRPAAAGGGAVGERVDLRWGSPTHLRQIVLRALLGTDQELSVQDIVDRCADLEGIKGCVLLRQDAFLMSRGLENSPAFAANAAKARDSVQSLAESLGLGTRGDFTLRSDHGVRSFFVEPGLCLGVWHDHPAFSGGTREKLTLIARELARIA